MSEPNKETSKEQLATDNGDDLEQTRPDGVPRFASSRDVIVRTEKLDEAGQFYAKVLGLRETLRSEKMLGFETGSFQLFVERGSPEHAPVFELIVPDRARAKELLVAAGCVVLEEDARVPRLYLRDPFGFVFNVGES
jgi:catechol 2,3-dioxygenase-like lactoylglutathione lyase family enzyme